jgi:hypothetical protein
MTTVTYVQNVKRLMAIFSINSLQAIELLDKGYTPEYLKEEYKDLPAAWVLELIK